MKREWKPGQIAMVELPSGGERPSVMIGHDPADRCWHSAEDNGDLRCLAAEAVAARPLVVIDPEDREAVERLLTLFKWPGEVPQYVIDDMQAALREFANPKPPKPEEPTGLGAVVEDEDGSLWVRVGVTIGDLHWRSTEPGDTNCFKWRAIAAVRVLSEGVQP